jgi:hypothetical protein
MTRTMTVCHNGEVLAEIPLTELPALILAHKVERSSVTGTCVWTYSVRGPMGEMLASGLTSHQAARKVALAHGYWPVETWTSPVAA